MKNSCSEEFDFYEVYQKLTSKSTPRVRACDFFKNRNELHLLQTKLNQLSKLHQHAMNKSAK